MDEKRGPRPAPAAPPDLGAPAGRAADGGGPLYPRFGPAIAGEVPQPARRTDAAAADTADRPDPHILRTRGGPIPQDRASRAARRDRGIGRERVYHAPAGGSTPVHPFPPRPPDRPQRPYAENRPAPPAGPALTPATLPPPAAPPWGAADPNPGRRPEGRRRPAPPAPAPAGGPPSADAAGWREDVVTLRNVPWDTYVALRDLPENRRAHFTYDADIDGGLLEIAVPTGSRHDTVLSLLRSLLQAYLEERRVPYRGVGQMTLTHLRRRGAEADAAFYLAHWDAVADPDAIDLDRDPPPDLAVEVVATHDLGAVKEGVYARLGVPELWVWRGGAVAVRVRTADGAGYEDAAGYDDAAVSPALPDFPFALAERTLAARAGADHGALVRTFRDAAGPPAA